MKKNEDQCQAHHRSGIKWDNRAYNISWTDSAENYAYSNGYPTKVRMIIGLRVD